ncbi:enoyl-CoA hydratase [Jannaschia sp. W003]|uniref:enoyl-CoA hydratase n=1 Tax=Jannaschia sp. W003 TaxID=2867012 RepID=UPI0021A50437|nr:enoyl-CoA hydratase [Jannaschia sp. W003]UWQ20915.1 enoyl-CoA hydratase [Jannaschia sp. W003]
MPQLVDVASEGAVTTITLDDPDRLNALGTPMLEALGGALAEAAASDARVVVLAARGRAFCAGHDLRELQAMRQAEDGGRAAHEALFDRCAGVMRAIREAPQPVIAQVHGMATAAGCQLVATCDMAVASEAARFGVNGVDLGLFCSTPMVALTRNLGRKRAFELLATGRFMDAGEAEAAGLVNHVVSADALEAETRALAEQVASKLPAAVRIGKGAFHAQAERPVAEAYALARDAIVANLQDPDTAEGIQAFLEKRPPGWTRP